MFMSIATSDDPQTLSSATAIPSAKPYDALQLQRELPQALHNGELSLVYQPQFSTNTGRICGAEALLRWQHSSKGQISPTHFIPVVEAAGLMPDIGAWVLQQACRRNKDWQDQGLAAIRVAVNVSASQLLQPDFSQLVQQTLARTGLEARWLELEITESQPLEEDACVDNTLQALAKLGVSLALDDFGTGFAALSTLGRYPFKRLKIARELVLQAGHGSNYDTIVDAISRLGRKLGMRILAEGIEDPQQLHFLRPYCCEAQGFLLGKPMSPGHLSALLAL